MGGGLPVFAMVTFLIAGAVEAATKENAAVSIGDIVNPLATLVAAFAGSWAAFKFQQFQQNKEDTENKIAAGNRALMTLLQQANTLKLFQIDFIEPYRNSPGRHIKIQSTLPFQEDSLVFDVRSLEFMFTPEYQQVLMDLILEGNRYREAIKSINTRSRHHFDVVQPKLAHAGFKNGGEYTGEEFKAALGDRDYVHLERLTDTVVLHVDRTVDSLVAMKGRLRAALLKQFPKGKFVDFELLRDAPKSIFS
jgi:hypothetical protein